MIGAFGGSGKIYFVKAGPLNLKLTQVTNFFIRLIIAGPGS